MTDWFDDEPNTRCQRCGWRKIWQRLVDGLCVECRALPPESSVSEAAVRRAQ
jgi:hypothetical protein